MVKDTDGPTVWPDGPRNKYDPEYVQIQADVAKLTRVQRGNSNSFLQLSNETATWPHVYQMGPPITGGIQCDGGITGGVPIT